MKKKMMTVLMVVAFAVATAGAAWAAKTLAKCEVTAIDGKNVTLNCDKTSKLKKGAKVKLKSAKARKIEGC